uniref:RNA ligase 2 C-terminal domain-containing protein n=1 Tax=viral metagenome TaxID=1070528 RepID=A0A6C0BR26_9ZZZZ
MVTEQRLTNVISGLGTVTNKDIGRVLNLFKEDVITEYEGELSAAEIRALMPALRTLVLARLS